MNYYLTVLKKYAVFKGRAHRKEYWMFVLFNLIVTIIIFFIGDFIGKDVGSLLVYIYNLAVLIPTFAVLIRRLHDTNHSGLWFFINFIPIIGGIVILLFTVRDSQPGKNQYGSNPKGIRANEVNKK